MGQKQSEDPGPPGGRAHGNMQIRSVLAPNPSMMTQKGTNTYILGAGKVAVIDPGPALATHKRALMAALSAHETVSHIFVTHTHLDHSGLAADLARSTGAKVHAFGTALAGRSATMQHLALGMDIGGGEGLDHTFKPDKILADGDRVAAESWQIEAIHTPGHLGNHLCFAAGDTLLSGDHVMGWSTSLISPPDGDMTDYMASLQKLAARPWAMFLPGHGPAVTDPAGRLADLIRHRRLREAALLDTLGKGPSNIDKMTAAVYPDLAPALIPAARRNVLAHLIDLESRNLITAHPAPLPRALFRRA